MDIDFYYFLFFISHDLFLIISPNILTSILLTAPNKMYEQCWENWYLGKL